MPLTTSITMSTSMVGNSFYYEMHVDAIAPVEYQQLPGSYEPSRHVVDQSFLTPTRRLRCATKPGARLGQRTCCVLTQSARTTPHADPNNRHRAYQRQSRSSHLEFGPAGRADRSIAPPGSSAHRGARPAR